MNRGLRVFFVLLVFLVVGGIIYWFLLRPAPDEVLVVSDVPEVCRQYEIVAPSEYQQCITNPKPYEEMQQRLATEALVTPMAEEVSQLPPPVVVSTTVPSTAPVLTECPLFAYAQRGEGIAAVARRAKGLPPLSPFVYGENQIIVDHFSSSGQFKGSYCLQDLMSRKVVSPIVQIGDKVCVSR